MSYEQAIKILETDNQEGFEYFLTLNAEQLGQLLQFLSQQQETRIFTFLKKSNHVPTKPNAETKPPFVDSIKSLYKRLYFPERSNGKPLEKDDNKPQESQVNWFKNIFEPENQKQKMKQTKFNYPYFSVVRRLLLAHNSEPQQQSVKVMHFQLEILMRRIFSQKLMGGLKRLLGINRDTYTIPREQTQKNLTSNHLKSYLAKIFQKQYKNFRQFKDQYQKIKKDVEVEPSDDDQEEDDQFIEPSKQLYTIADTNEQAQYYLQKTQNLNDDQIMEFYRARQTNFLKQGAQKLITFTKLNNILSQAKNRQLLELLSYILCMTARRIIFVKIRQIGKGKLLPTDQKICSQDIQRIGNQFIQQVQKKAKSYCLKYQTFIKKAFDLFKSQFFEQGYDLIYLSDTKIKLMRTEQDGIQNDKEDKILQTWKKSKQCRKAWYQRVVAQAQNKQHQQQQQQYKPANQYGQYLLKNKDKFKSISHSKLFKSFLLKQPIEIVPSKPSRRLQSLFK